MATTATILLSILTIILLLILIMIKLSKLLFSPNSPPKYRNAIRTYLPLNNETRNNITINNNNNNNNGTNKNNNNRNNNTHNQNNHTSDSSFKTSTENISRTRRVTTILVVPTATLLGFIWYWLNWNKSDLEIRLYNLLPLRATSSLWGKINSYDLPVWMRSRLFDLFCKTYNCDMSEALESDYKNYKNLSEFFGRRLKPDSRPISQEPGVVSPADGLVLHFGPVENGRIEGVKGLNYSMSSFLGLENSNDDNDYEKQLLVNPGENQLYNCIIYLAPGDYHRFHSPANWSVNYRKHFPGRLHSVRPALIKRLPILNINERVCYFGNWQHGFFSMTAVGATNVGSIKVYFDEELRTNRRLLWRPDNYACFEHGFSENISLSAGEDFGEFKFGSTIVLIFEAPKNSNFDMVGDNQKIKFGQLLARIEPPKANNNTNNSTKVDPGGKRTSDSSRKLGLKVE